MNALRTDLPDLPYLPTAEQTLLLRAALLSGDEAIAAWHAWIARVDIESDLDTDAYRLLARLHKNLSEQGVEHAWMERLKGVRRQNVYKNHHKLRRVTHLLAQLQTQGVATLLLRDAALLVHVEADRSLRPLTDVAVLIHPRDLEKTLRLLRDEQWHPLHHSYEQLLSGGWRCRHAARFQDGDDNTLELHWHLLANFLEAGAEDDFWASAEKIEVNGVTTQCLNATDQLLHLCARAASWTEIASVRWIADAYVLLTQANSVDWDRLLHQAARCHVVQPLQITLTYLATQFAAPIPPEVLRRLSQLPVPFVERQRYAALSAQGQKGLRHLWHTFWRHTGNFYYSDFRTHPLGFVAYLQCKAKARRSRRLKPSG